MPSLTKHRKPIRGRPRNLSCHLRNQRLLVPNSGSVGRGGELQSFDVYAAGGDLGHGDDLSAKVDGSGKRVLARGQME